MESKWDFDKCKLGALLHYFAWRKYRDERVTYKMTTNHVFEVI